MPCTFNHLICTIGRPMHSLRRKRHKSNRNRSHSSPNRQPSHVGKVTDRRIVTGKTDESIRSAMTRVTRNWSTQRSLNRLTMNWCKYVWRTYKIRRHWRRCAFLNSHCRSTAWLNMIRELWTATWRTWVLSVKPKCWIFNQNQMLWSCPRVRRCCVSNWTMRKLWCR